MHKVLAFLFWQLRQLFRMLSDDGLADWKALIIIGVCEILTVLTFVFWASVAAGYRLWPTSRGWTYVAVLGLASLLYGFNYFLLTYRNRWIRFQTEFENYPARIRLAGGIATILVVVVVVIGTGWSATAVRHLPH